MLLNIFFKFVAFSFNNSSNTVVKFLSNKSNLIDDIVVVFKMPKWIFIKSLFN